MYLAWEGIQNTLYTLFYGLNVLKFHLVPRIQYSQYILYKETKMSSAISYSSSNGGNAAQQMEHPRRINDPTTKRISDPTTKCYGYFVGFSVFILVAAIICSYLTFRTDEDHILKIISLSVVVVSVVTTSIFASCYCVKKKKR